MAREPLPIPNMRVQKTFGGTTTVYIFSGNKVLDEYTNGALSEEYIYRGTGLGVQRRFNAHRFEEIPGDITRPNRLMVAVDAQSLRPEIIDRRRQVGKYGRQLFADVLEIRIRKVGGVSAVDFF